MNQSQRTLQEYHTTATPAEVIAEAKEFFPRRNSLYATFIDREGPAFVSFRGQGGEELIIAAVADGARTRVTGSTYLFDMQIARFFTTLPPFQLEETLLPESASAAGTGA
ncbi:MAG: hypothetical protein ACJ79A_00530 [Gemmatimonadaceae bacterium]